MKPTISFADIIKRVNEDGRYTVQDGDETGWLVMWGDEVIERAPSEEAAWRLAYSEVCYNYAEAAEEAESEHYWEDYL